MLSRWKVNTLNKCYINIIKSFFIYACMLRIGDGIPINKELAASYYKKAADKGDVRSMHTLSLMLKNGDGIPPNLQESIKYLKMAFLTACVLE